MNHIVFLIAYVYFFINDIKDRKINIIAIAIYAIAALLTLVLTSQNMTMSKFVDILYSLAFGLCIYLLSYFSEEGIGLADAMFFVINGFILSLRENITLFLTGIIFAFIISLLIITFKKNLDEDDTKLPFMPCILPAVIGYIICIV